jgi:hypothetical protein
MGAKSKYGNSIGPFNTLEEANAAKPAGDKRRLYAVTGPDGKALYTWANGSGSALIYAARHLGYQATRQDKAPTREKVAGMLAQLSDEDRALLIRQLVPAPEQPAGPAPEKPAGGKKSGK